MLFRSYGQPGYGQGQPGGYGQPPQGYGQPPGFSTPPAKSRSTQYAIIAAVVALVLLVVAALVFFLRTTVFDATAVAQGVGSVLTEQYRVADVGAVTCPGGEEVETGATFECTATIAGEQVPITVTVVDDSGTYTVSRP